MSHPVFFFSPFTFFARAIAAVAATKMRVTFLFAHSIRAILISLLFKAAIAFVSEKIYKTQFLLCSSKAAVKINFFACARAF